MSMHIVAGIRRNPGEVWGVITGQIECKLAEINNISHARRIILDICIGDKRIVLAPIVARCTRQLIRVAI